MASTRVATAFLLVLGAACATASSPGAREDDEAILGEIRAHKEEVKACRDAHRAAQASLTRSRAHLQVTVAFVITSSGAAERVSFRPPEVEDTTFARCMRPKIATWRFPPREKAEPVDFPMMLDW